jgi:hypothetical protein
VNADPLRPPETDDDPLAPARGCLIAGTIGGLAWIITIALVMAWRAA